MRWYWQWASGLLLGVMFWVFVAISRKLPVSAGFGWESGDLAMLIAFACAFACGIVFARKTV